MKLEITTIFALSYGFFRTIEAIDTVPGNLDRSLHKKIISHVPLGPSMTIGLHETLCLGLEMPAEMCVNVDVTDGLTNGAMCVIKRFDYRVKNSHRCSIVWVEFDNSSVGQMWKMKHTFIHTRNASFLGTNAGDKQEVYFTVLQDLPCSQETVSSSTCCSKNNSQITRLIYAFCCFALWNEKNQSCSLCRFKSFNKFVRNLPFALKPRKKSVCPEVVDEMMQLCHERPLPFCIPDLPSSINRTESMAFCFQNCRSLQKHFDNIKNEWNMFSSDIMEFVEARMYFPLDKAYDIKGFHFFVQTKMMHPMVLLCITAIQILFPM